MTTAVANGVLVEKPRISSIDLMRGIVMVIMALDHSRDFFHLGALEFQPNDMERTNPILFFTRWITHFCAPTFVFLSGTSIRINMMRKSKKELSIFLLTRGLWLIFLELTVLRFGIIMEFSFSTILFQVIWVIGASMVILSALIHLPAKAVLTIGLLIVFGHNLLDGISFKPEEGLPFVVWSFLHSQAFFGESPAVLIMYPLIPWLGIMCSGFGLGELYAKDFDPERRQKLLLTVGLTAIALFIVLRYINIYGDPTPWNSQKNGLFTFMSFLNCLKYPPSLLYTLMTLGPTMVFLSVMERSDVKILKPFLVFGRVPMFYYILHFYILHVSAIAVHMIMNNVSFDKLVLGFPTFGTPAEGRHPLIIAYIAWIAVVLLLYPLCKWYNKYKSTHTQWWLSYL